MESTATPKRTRLIIFLQNVKIDDILFGLPPVVGATIYAGCPGRRLKVIDVHGANEFYRVDTEEL